MAHNTQTHTNPYLKGAVRLLFSLMWLMGSGGCLSPKTEVIHMTKGDVMIIDDKVYEDIETGILGPTPCSPQKPEDPSFRGILINAPQRVTFIQGRLVPETNTFAKIPICGYYHLNVIYRPKYPSILEGMRMVAINTETQEKYVGPVIDCSDAVRPPKSIPFTKEELEGISVAAYFNPNLLEFVPLPEVPGVYEVYIELGEKGEDPYFRSNTVTIVIMAVER